MTRLPASTKPKVLLIHTGGTIAMRSIAGRPGERALRPAKGFTKDLMKRIPELKEIADIDVHLYSNKDSSQITVQDWIALSEIIAKHYKTHAGFVITHGTDSMAYTGAALSYLLPYPCKPVILTGSQRPLEALHNDARRNLIHSVAIAAKGSGNSVGSQQWICECCVFFDDKLFRANRVKKTHIEQFHAFESPNFPFLIHEQLKPVHTSFARELIRKPKLAARFDARIQVNKVFPGVELRLMPNSQAVVLESYGSGNLPIADRKKGSAENFLKRCSKKRIPVVMVSQVLAGGLSPSTYEMGRRALELGAISARDMTFEAALVKTMILAGNQVDYELWPQLMTSNWAGEVSALS